MPVGLHRYYVVDHEFVPTATTQVRMYGLDVNGDGTVDNQLGMVLATMASMGLDLQGAISTAVDRGAILMLIDFQTTDLTSAVNVGFATYAGTNPQPLPCNGSTDTVCRHHLAGNGSFGIDPAIQRDPALLGNVAAGTYTSGAGGVMSIQIALFGAPLRLDLIGARVELSGITETSVASGMVAGAVTTGEIDTKIIPFQQQQSMVIVQRDCSNLQQPPDCGCTAGSPGRSLLSLFDIAPTDCQITVDEVRRNSVNRALLAPDVMIHGQQALSFGFNITAVHGDFTL